MRSPERFQKDSNNQHQPQKPNDKNLFKSNVSDSQTPFYLTKRFTFATYLTVTLLICGICLAVVVTLWLTSAITSTSTVAARTIIYSQNFTNGHTATAQCTVWTSFVAQLIQQPYILLTMSGTFDPIGVSVTDPTVIANISLALRTSTAYGPVTSNSNSWAVGLCGPSYELSASGTTCMCRTPGYSIRPCLTNQNYGGVNTTTCSGPNQTMTVIFQY
ncbi:unnamed protein product [Rotaria socialis]|uniref:Uncharacterized protein n=1 Tax=Rotaria socialis TaxID=392032 RepID=A0A821IER7_9BILA|nr:unnamed protein product [Rotaria socialis]CAF4700430.1 unnamed protein product [Rotaria socialis]